MSEEKVDVLGDYEIHYTDHEYYMDFAIWEITGLQENPVTHVFDVPVYGDGPDGFVPSRDDVKPFWEGHIKWDGCSNWDFKMHECMAHFCGKKSATSIGLLMARCYELAATMEKYDRDER